MSSPFVYRPGRGASRARARESSRPYSANSATDTAGLQQMSHSQPLAGNSSNNHDPAANDLGLPDDTQNVGLLLQRCYQGIQSNNRFLIRMQDSISALTRQMNIIAEQVSATERNQFTLKAVHLEKPLRVAVAKVFVKSVKRQITDKDILEVIPAVLGPVHSSVKFKCDLALAKSKELMTTFRAEERRRIYGRSPCQSAKNKTTSELADDLVKFYQAPPESRDIYIKNLAILRLYIRMVPDAEHTKNFYSNFRTWLLDSYALGQPDEEGYTEVLQRDEEHDYIMYPTTPSPNELALGTDDSTDTDHLIIEEEEQQEEEELCEQ